MCLGVQAGCCGSPPASAGWGAGDGAGLRLPLIIGAEGGEQGTSPLRNPGAPLGLGGPWGPSPFWWVGPFFAGAQPLPQNHLGACLKSRVQVMQHWCSTGGDLHPPPPCSQGSTWQRLQTFFWLSQLQLCSRQGAAAHPTELRSALGEGQKYLVQSVASAEVEKPGPTEPTVSKGRGVFICDKPRTFHCWLPSD